MNKESKTDAVRMVDAKGDAKTGTKSDERRRMPRLNLGSEQFKLQPSGKIFPIADLSTQGMGFWVLEVEDLNKFSVGLLLEGYLNLKREKYSVCARVRSLLIDRVGCEFEETDSVVTQAIQKYLDPSSLGLQMRPYPSEIRSTLWYFGPNGTDLIFKRSTDGRYNRLELNVLGQFVQWDESEGLSTGSVEAATEPSEVRGILRMETILRKKDGHPDPSKLDVAKTLILSSKIPEDLKSWCIRQLGERNGS